MMKIISILILVFLFTGFLNAQVIDSKTCDCDSILRAKIETRVMFLINGRVAKALIRPDNVTCEIGKFYFDILVNREGDIIQADLNTRFSSKISDNLKAILIDAIVKSKFMDENDAPAKQKGNITYEFLLNDKN